MRSTADRGFTLVEVLVALVVTAMVALLAHRVFAATVDGARELRNERVELDRQMNAQRLLASAFLSLDVGEQAGSFEGHPEQVDFATWRLTADGWSERTRVRLGVEDGRLLYVDGSAPAVALADSVAAIGLDYLLEPGAVTHWVGEWVSPVSAPLAVRVRISRRLRSGRLVGDTALFLIKARG